jgi:chromosome segregation ATPase
LLLHKISCVEERKKLELQQIQEHKWKAMDTNRKKLERKLDKSDADANLAEKLTDMLSRDNERVRGQVDLVTDYCQTLKRMNAHLEQTIAVHRTNYLMIKSTMDIVDQQNERLKEELDRLKRKLTSTKKYIQDTDRLAELERKAKDEIEETIDGILNTVQARCKNVRLVTYVFDLHVRLSSPDGDGTQPQYVQDNTDALSEAAESYYSYITGSKSVISESSVSSNLSVLLANIAAATKNCETDLG